MSNLKKILFILAICFMCILIPNISSATYKTEREFILPKGKCTNKEHSNCVTYTAINPSLDKVTIHVGTYGYSEGSKKIEIDKATGVICLQHNFDSNDEFAEQHLAIQYRIKIDQNKVRVIPISREAREKSKEKNNNEDKTDYVIEDSMYSARFAYILSHISDKAGSENRYENQTQGAAWDLIPDFWKELKSDTNFETGDGQGIGATLKKKAKPLIDEAKAYGDFSRSANFKNHASKEGTTVRIEELNSNYYKIGPFKVKYASSSYKKSKDEVIEFAGYTSSSLKIDDNDVNDFKFCDSSGKEINKPNNNGTDFYIKIPKNKIGKRGSLTIRTKKMKVKADLFTETNSSGRQEQCILTLGKRYYENESVTIDFDTTGNLRIVKTDKDTNERLIGVKFKIKDSNGKYLQITDSKNNVQTSVTGIINVKSFTLTKKEYATELVTNSKGIIEIHNLVTNNYIVEETSLGDNYGYILNNNYIYWNNGKKDEQDKTGLKRVFVSGQPASNTNNNNSLVKDDYVTILNVKNTRKVGDLSLEKIDSRNFAKKLANVEFVILSSYNQQYIKIKTTEGLQTRVTGDVTVTGMQYTTNKEEATRFVADQNGKLSIKELLAMSNDEKEIKYNIVEVYNPNDLYEADYESGYISLSKNTIKATNKQVYINLEGYIWEEIAVSKDNVINNLYNNTDALIEGIKVSLYKDNNFIESTVTDEDGKYRFEGAKKIKIDELDKYYVEFEYDGLRFTNIPANTEYSNDNYSITSKAVEEETGRGDRKDRKSVNADFSEITNGKSRNNGKEVYTLEYDLSNNISTYKDHWGYKYNDEKTKLKVTPSEDYNIIASTKTSGFNLKKAWEAQCEKESNETLTGINLGIERREQADLAISTDISSLNVIVQNYENTYTYEKRKEYEDGNEEEKDGFGTEVKFGSKYGTSYSNRGLNMYTRRIYESDLAIYNQDSSNANLMQIYVTYKITVKNQSTELTSTVNELTNYYDSRYSIADSWIVNGNNTKQIGASGWANKSKYGNSYNENGYIAGYTKATSDIKIAPNEKIELYIKFSLEREAIKALIEKQTTLNNVTEISAFSTEMLNNNTWAPYACIDVDSNPGSITSIKFDENNIVTTKLNGRDYKIENKILNKNDYEDDTDIAPSLILGIEENEPTRGLSGTVFEDEDALHNDDNTHIGEERLGDGILHTGGEYRGKGKYGKTDTNRVKGAKVELLEYDENATDHIAKDAEGNAKIATLYKLNVNESGEISTKTETAVTSTDSKGDYVFAGVIPGRYLIRYTYGGDNCYITNSGGEQIEQVNAVDYKSTIITSDIMRVALNLNKKYSSENEKEGDLNWILKYDSIPDNDNYTTDAKSKSKDLSGLIRYSGATDDLDKREKMEDLYNGLYESKFEMTSDTAFFDVGVEYSEVKELEGFSNKISYTDYTDEYQLDGDKILVLDDNGKLKIVDTFYAVNPYQDFGIIERARQDYDTNKRISNFKVILANGQVLINGNPYQVQDKADTQNYWNNLEKVSNEPLPYVKALPGQVIAEIDNEILQGATLNVEYTISIWNKSEIDYGFKKNQDYYYYGKTVDEKSNKVIRKIVDYMEDDLVYNDEQNTSIGWTKVQVSDLYNWTRDEDNNSKQLISGEVKEAVEKKKGYTIAVTEYFYQDGNEIEPGAIGDIKLYGSKVLSSSEKGTSIINHTEIIETMGVRTIKESTPGNYNPVDMQPDENDDDRTLLSITPPTGLLENKVFIISTVVISMIVLAGGVYFIKERVLE